MKKPINNEAFTLVELAIVIVIIGLLVGGVLQGQELIKQAQIRSDVKRMQELSSSYWIYYTKYNTISGDNPKATTFFSDSNILNGDGDRKIEVTDDASPATIAAYQEPAQALYQIIAAKIITSKNNPWNTSSPSPLYTYNGKEWMFYYYNSATMISTPNMQGNVVSVGKMDSGGFNVGGVYSGAEAMNMDEKIDDGKPNSGIFRGAYEYLTYWTPSAGCMDTTTNTYDLTEPNKKCRAFFLLDK